MCACQLVFLFVYLPVCMQYWMNTPSLFPRICVQMLLLPCMSSLRVLFRRLPVTLSSLLFVCIYGSLCLSLSLMFCVLQFTYSLCLAPFPTQAFTTGGLWEGCNIYGRVEEHVIFNLKRVVTEIKQVDGNFTEYQINYRFFTGRVGGRYFIGSHRPCLYVSTFQKAAKPQNIRCTFIGFSWVEDLLFQNGCYFQDAWFLRTLGISLYLG